MLDIIFELFTNSLFSETLAIVPLIAAPVIAAAAGGGAAAGAGAATVGAGAAVGGGAAAGGGGLLSGLLGGKAPSIASGVLGIGQQIAGAIKETQAERQLPPAEDPEMRAFLQDIQRRRKQLQTGAALEPQAAEIRKQQAQTQRNVARLSGGAGGAAIQGLVRAQRASQVGLGEAAAKSAQQEAFLTQLAGTTIRDIAQRRLELQLLQRSQALAESAQLKGTGMANILASAGMQIPVGQPQGGVTGAPTGGTQVTTQAGQGISFQQISDIIDQRLKRGR